MCAATPRPRREPTLWWALVSYFHVYPPLIQREGLQAQSQAGQSASEAAPKAQRPPIRFYW